jgi:hypothetical protein
MSVNVKENKNNKSKRDMEKKSSTKGFLNYGCSFK